MKRKIFTFCTKPSIYDDFKVLCENQNISMSRKIELLILKELEKNKKGTNSEKVSIHI